MDNEKEKGGGRCLDNKKVVSDLYVEFMSKGYAIQ
jgi:hypothetical protein